MLCNCCIVPIEVRCLHSQHFCKPLIHQSCSKTGHFFHLDRNPHNRHGSANLVGNAKIPLDQQRSNAVRSPLHDGTSELDRDFYQRQTSPYRHQNRNLFLKIARYCDHLPMLNLSIHRF